MCMQMEDRAPLQEGDNGKITTFKYFFSLKQLGQCQLNLA